MKIRLVDGMGNSKLVEVPTPPPVYKVPMRPAKTALNYAPDPSKISLSAVEFVPRSNGLPGAVLTGDFLMDITVLGLHERDRDGMLVYRQTGVPPAPIRYDDKPVVK